MKKTLFLSFFYMPESGGIQSYLYNIIKRLPPERVVVMAEPMKDDRVFDMKQKYTTIRETYQSPLRYLKLSSIHLFFKVMKIVRQKKIEKIAVGHIMPLGLTALLIRKIWRKPYIVFTHGMEVLEVENGRKPVKKWVMGKVFKNAESIVVTTNFMKEIIEQYPVASDRIKISPPGVDSEFYRDGLDANRLKTRYGIENKKVILSVGRLVERKGFDMVIKAMPQILKRNPEAVYVIVGRSEYYEEILKRMVDKLNLKDKVIFIGEARDEEMPLFFNMGEFFIMPSREVDGDIEGFGIVFLEAAACGKACVGGNTGGVAEAIADGVTGKLVDPTNVNQIAEVCSKLLLYPDISNKFGRNGRERAVKDFSWDVIVEKLRIIFEQ